MENTKIDKAKLALQISSYYDEISKLEEKYMNSTLKRKEIAKEIETLTDKINNILTTLNRENYLIHSKYENAEKNISDYHMAMRLILKLANSACEEYSLKEYQLSEYGQFNNSNKAWIIGNKDILNEIPNEQIYYGKGFSNITDYIITKGYSLIILTDYYAKDLANPKSLPIKLEKISIKNSDMFVSDINCYLYNDTLKNAVHKLMSFINSNGADLKGIDEEAVLAALSNTPSNKKLTLNNS